jgi:glutamyl-tRNA reductase
MREAERAEAIIEEEIAEFLRWQESLEVVPTVAAIRAKAEAIRQAELERALKRLGGLSGKELATIDALTCAIVNKMLHGPTARLKAAADEADGYLVVEAARELYGLDESETSRGPGLLRSLLNRRAREIHDAHAANETGDGLGC